MQGVITTTLNCDPECGISTSVREEIGTCIKTINNYNVHVVVFSFLTNRNAPPSNRTAVDPAPILLVVSQQTSHPIAFPPGTLMISRATSGSGRQRILLPLRVHVWILQIFADLADIPGLVHIRLTTRRCPRRCL